MTSSNEGEQRAYRTLALLSLQRRGPVYDNGGRATHALQTRFVTKPVTANGMSRALHSLQQDELVRVEIEGRSGCIGIQLAGELTEASVQSLTREEDWAQCIVRKREYSGPPIGRAPRLQLKGREPEAPAAPTTQPALEPQGQPAPAAASLDYDKRLDRVEAFIADFDVQLQRINQRLDGLGAPPAANEAVEPAQAVHLPGPSRGGRPRMADVAQQIQHRRHPLTATATP
jgi:hypothetical protein